METTRENKEESQVTHLMKLLENRDAYISCLEEKLKPTNKVTEGEIEKIALEYISNPDISDIDGFLFTTKDIDKAVQFGIRKGLSLSTQEKQPEREPDGYIVGTYETFFTKDEYIENKERFDRLNSKIRPVVYFENIQQITEGKG